MSLIIREVLARARRRLRGADFEPSTREAALLLGHLLGWTESQVLAREDRPLSVTDHRRFEQTLDRRLAGEPVAYIVGHKEFYGRDFVVDSRVLIPRPETEHMVDMALDLALPRRPRLLDVGTGSGCLACTLALELPASRVVASDVSAAALAVAARNRRHHGLLDRLHLVAADLAAGIRLAGFDLVVSNPPYIGSSRAEDLSREIIDFEPAGALFAGPDGSQVHRRLLTGMTGLPRGAWMMLEIDARQGELFRQLGDETPFRLFELRDDYAGLPRVALLQRR